MKILKKLFANVNFLALLREAAEITFETQLEAGFAVFKRGKKLSFSRVSTGEKTKNGDLESDGVLISFDECPSWMHQWGSLHFHPSDDEPIDPSGPDLNLLRYHQFENGEIRPFNHWIIVGRVDSQKNIRLLMIERAAPRTSFDYDEKCEEILGCMELEEANGELRQTENSIMKALAVVGFNITCVDVEFSALAEKLAERTKGESSS